MQVLVLGMHRSGTSVLTHLLSRMGCHAGSPETLKPADSANQRGYWERWDAWALNEQILAAAHASWREVADLDLDSLAEDDRSRFAAHARELVADLDQHRPWVIKDPRLCLLLPLWRPALTEPVVVLTHRNPLETARSLLQRDGLPLAVGIALWEHHNLAALRHSLGMRRLSVSYERLLRDPQGVATELAAALGALAPGVLSVPTAGELAQIVAPDLHHQRARAKEVDPYLNANQRKLWRALEEATALAWKVVPACSAGALDTLRTHSVGDHEMLRLRQRDAEISNWNETLTQRLAPTEAELDRLRLRDAEISNWNEALTARLAAAEAELDRLRQRDAEITARCVEVEGEAAWRREREAEHERWIASLRAAVAQGDAELDRLRQRDAEISAWNETLTERLATEASEHRRQAASLAARIDEQRRVLDGLRDEADESRRRAAALSGLLGETAHHAEQRGQLADEFDRLVAEILRSRSWWLGRSLTAPARWGRSAVLAESRHERLRRAAESLATAERALAARRGAAEEAPPVEPEGGV